MPDHKKLLIILAIALALRLLLLPFFWDRPLQIVDETHYQAIAENLLQHQQFAVHTGKPTSIRPPLYPVFLSAVYYVTGGVHLNMVRLLQIGLSLVLIYLVYRLGQRLFDEKVGRVAAWIMAVYPSFVVFTHFILTEILFTVLLLLFVTFFASFLQERSYAPLFWAGLFLGLAALTRSILYPFIIIAVGFLFVAVQGSVRQKTKWALLVTAGYLLMVAPWSLRNSLLHDNLVAVDTMGGLNLYMGNYDHTPLNRAWTAIDLQGDRTWYHGHESVLSGMNEAEKQKWAMKQGLDFMLNHKFLTLKRSLIKAANFWGLERSVIGGILNDHYPDLNKKAALLFVSPLIFASYALVMLGAVVGLTHTLTRKSLFALFFLVLIGYFTTVHAVIFGHPRYHLPLMPLLALFASWSLVHCKAIWQKRKALRFKVSGFVCGVLLLVWLREILIVEGARYLGTI